MSADAAAFYCVADSTYFPGAVAMINSLRVLGCRDSVYVLDRGLTADQRDVLRAEATLIPGETDVPACLEKTVAPLRHPEDVVVLVDADVVFTRSPAELIERAAAGRIVAFEDDAERHFPEWGALLGLPAPRRQPYVSSSLMLLGGALGRRVLELMDSAQGKIDIAGSPFEGTAPDRAVFASDYVTVAANHPFFYPEQDVLNAILASEVDRDALEVQDRRLEANPPFSGLKVVDEHTLRCSYSDGVEPYALHHFAFKPWIERTFHSPYSRLLRRLLLERDVPMRIDERELPLRLRTGAVAWIARTAVSAFDLARWKLRSR